MELRGQLLVGQTQRFRDFNSQRTGVLESERQEFNFSNHSITGHHHSHRSEESFEVIRELRASSVSRVHGDVDIALVLENKLSSEEVKGSLFPGNSVLNARNLRSNDREHFGVNSVEFIEAEPCSRRSLTLEELSHSGMV